MPSSNQTNFAIDKFIVANLEMEDLNLPKEYFDVIIAGDVLEHLVDPWKFVENLTKFLKKDGIFIICVPNIREISTISKIFFGGSFKYDPERGIMDKTHLLFLCKKKI
jgi:2-polyprenyl-3-methyl-5-hydroxy-6-metoxy-1,4-benzoquinol methylase